MKSLENYLNKILKLILEITLRDTFRLNFNKNSSKRYINLLFIKYDLHKVRFESS